MTFSLLRLAAALAFVAAALPAPAAAAAADVPLPPPPPGTRRLEVPAATAPAGGRSYWIGLSAGPFAALDKGASGAVMLDVGWTAQPAWWRAHPAVLEWHLVARAARPTYEAGLTRDVDVGGGTTVPMQLGTVTLDAAVIEVVPTARALRPIGPGLWLFADLGVGVYQTIEKKVTDEQYLGRTEERTNVTGVVLTAAAGFAFEPNDRLRIILQPLAVSRQLGTRYSGFSPQLGLAFRL